MKGETAQSTVDKAKDRGSVLQSRVEDSLSPPLKWAGGKHWQLPHLLPLWMGHEGRRLVEPFCGGLAVPFGCNLMQHKVLALFHQHLMAEALHRTGCHAPGRRRGSRPEPHLDQNVVPSIYSSASPWVGSQPCGAKYPGFCADSKGV